MTCWPDKTGLKQMFSNSKCSNFRQPKIFSSLISVGSTQVLSSSRWLPTKSSTEFPSCFQCQQLHSSSRSLSPPNSLTKDLLSTWCRVSNTSTLTPIQLSIRGHLFKDGLRTHLSPKWSKTSTRNSWRVPQSQSKLVHHLSISSSRCKPVLLHLSNLLSPNRLSLRRRKDTMARS